VATPRQSRVEPPRSYAPLLVLVVGSVSVMTSNFIQLTPLRKLTLQVKDGLSVAELGSTSFVKGGLWEKIKIL
jgi:hypothetical protein